MSKKRKAEKIEVNKFKNSTPNERTSALERTTKPVVLPSNMDQDLASLCSTYAGAMRLVIRQRIEVNSVLHKYYGQNWSES